MVISSGHFNVFRFWGWVVFHLQKLLVSLFVDFLLLVLFFVKDDVVVHSENELKRVGMEFTEKTKKKLIASVKIISIFSFGMSEYSSNQFFLALSRLLKMRNLTDITDSEDEWEFAGEYDGKKFWQNVRNRSLFSLDGGKTHFRLKDVIGLNGWNEGWTKRMKILKKVTKKSVHV